MKRFLYTLLWFVLPIIAVFITSIFLPPTPKASRTSLFTSVAKDSLLANVQSPRLILVGGSNLSFGINSHILKDSLHMNPVNTGVHALLTLKYMLDNTLQYVKAGDVVVLIPEYEHFFKQYNIGTEELFRTVVDVNMSKIKLLDAEQLYHILPFLPRYAIVKFKPTEYAANDNNPVYYKRNSINEFGDESTHWGMQGKYFAPYKIKADYNPDVVLKIKAFEKEVTKRHAVFFMSFPDYQDSSFNNSAEKIAKVEAELCKNFNVLGTAKRYEMPDSLMFDTPYHLVKKGVDYRTELLVEDLRKVLDKGMVINSTGSNVY